MAVTGGEVLAIVPGRGGSKGVPGKNIRNLAGRPMIAYTIRAAQLAAGVRRVVVTTDCEAIASVALSLGAEVPFMRPADLAGDTVTDLPVFQHCLAWLRDHESYEPDLVVHLRPTAPLRTEAHIDQALQILLSDPAADSVRSVCLSGEHPLKTWTIREDGRLDPFVDPATHGLAEPYNRPRQGLPPAFVQNGSVDVIRTRVIHQGSMTGRVIKGMVMSPTESINVDREIDFRLAELLLVERARRT